MAQGEGCDPSACSPIQCRQKRWRNVAAGIPFGTCAFTIRLVPRSGEGRRSRTYSEDFSSHVIQLQYAPNQTTQCRRCDSLTGTWCPHGQSPIVAGEGRVANKIVMDVWFERVV